MKTQCVDPKNLQFSPWNANHVSPDNQRRLEESIRRNGLFRPVVVRELPTGELEVIAGEHTTRAAIAIGYDQIDVYNLGPIDDKRAKEIAVVDNRHYGLEDTLKLSSLLKDIEGDVTEFMPFSDNDLKEIFQSDSIDLDSLELDLSFSKPEEPTPLDEVTSAPQTHQIMRFKVPLEDADRVTRIMEAVMKRQGFTGQDSLANAGDALVYLCSNWSQKD